MEMDTRIVLAHLAMLEERGLVQVSGEGRARTLRFKHALTREASYNSILTTRRAELHRNVAGIIQELYPERDATLALSLAEHWLNAREYAQVSAELLPRARQLVSGGHSQALIQLLERAQSPGAENLDLDVLITRGDAHEALGQYEQARELYEKALGLAPDQVMQSRLLYHLGMSYYRLSQYPRAIEYHLHSLDLATQNGDAWQQARTLKGLGLAYWNSSDYENAAATLERARDLCAKTGDPIVLGDIELDLANVYRDRGEYARAIVTGEHALALFEENALPILAGYADLALGGCYYSAGEPEKAITFYRRATEISRQLNDPLGLATGLSNLGELTQNLGEFEQAAAYFTEAIDLARKLKNDYVLAFALTGLGEVQLLQAQAGGPVALLDAARTMSEEAVEVGRRLCSNERLGAAHRLIAQIYAAQDDWGQAEAHACEAVERLEMVGHAMELKRAYAVYEKILSASNRTETRG